MTALTTIQTTIPHLEGDAFLSLVGERVRLVKVARSRGGEWEGPCPFCGGKNRFRVQPYAPEGGRWYCRSCDVAGTGHWGSDIDYVMQRDGLDFKAACEVLHIALGGGARPAQPRDPMAPEIAAAPPAAWQAAGLGFLDYCANALWADAGSQARIGLFGRGLDASTLSGAAIGYNPSPLRRPAAKWGIEDEDEDAGVYLPEGYVFPWFVEGELWKINIRQTREDARSKYLTVRGSGNAPYGLDTLQPGQPCVLVEGVIDALVCHQAAGQFADQDYGRLCGAVAVGTTGARAVTWMMRLSRCSRLLVALDADAAGEMAAGYWLDIFARKALRWLPDRKDPGEMAQAGLDVRDWLQRGLIEADHAS